MMPFVRMACSLFLIAALTVGLFYNLNHSRPHLANDDGLTPQDRPLGLLANLIALGAVASFLVLLLGVEE